MPERVSGGWDRDGWNGSNWDDSPWTSWSGDVSLVPTRHYHPTSLAELVQLVRDAEAHDPPQRVHASGSHWAFSTPAATDGYAVETYALSASLDTDITAMLRQDADPGPSPWGSSTLGIYHVESGVQLHELCLRLDGQCPGTPKPVVLGRTVSPGVASPARWALPTMGGASGQTLAGAMSTGVHGMDVHLPPLADVVRAVHLVGAGGRQYWIERGPGVTRPEVIRDTYPGIEVQFDDDLWAAAVVSLGRFGIIYAALIDVVPQFALTSTTRVDSWANAADTLREGSIFTDNRSVQVLISPYADQDSTGPSAHPDPGQQRSCRITTRQVSETPVPLAAHQTVSRLASSVVNHGGRMLHLMRSVLLALWAILVLVLVVAQMWSVTAPAWRTWTTWTAWILLCLQLVVLIALTAAVGRPGDVVARVCSWANRHRRWPLTARIVAAVLGSAVPPGTTTGVGYQVMAGAPWVDEYYRGRAVEMFFDATNAAYLDVISRHLLPVIENAAREGHAVAGWFSLRFTGRTAALIGMQRWDRTACVEVAVLRGIPGSIEVLRQLQQTATTHGGLIHWGQQNDWTEAEVLAAYPGLSRWRQELARLVASAAEARTFENDFCRDRGLAP